jgi:hypothetical protein
MGVHPVLAGEPCYGSQFDVGALLFAQRFEKQVNVSLFTAFASNPDGALPIQITDDDPVVMSFTDGDLVNADDPGCWQSRQVNQPLHIELVEILHRAVGAGAPSWRQLCSAYHGTAYPPAWQSVAYSEGSSPTSPDALHARRRTSGS